MATEQKTILVVDDEPFFREEVVAFLSNSAFAARGWEMEAAASGEEALDRLEHAVNWYKQGVALMEQQQQSNESFMELRQQAEQLLGIAAPQTVKN